MRMAALAVLIAGLAAACGGVSDGNSDIDTSRVPTTAATSPATTQVESGATTTSSTSREPTPAPSALDETEAGVYGLDSGQSVTIRLDNDWVWTGPAIDGTSVEVIRANYRTDPGFVEFEVRATGPGRAVVSWLGEPNCELPANCPDIEVRYEFAS